MDPDKPRMKIRAGDVIRLAVVIGCVVGGIILRFQPMPTSILGGGLIVLGVVLLAYWAKQPPRP